MNVFLNPADRFALRSSRIVTPDAVRAGAVIVSGERIEAIVNPAEVPVDVAIRDVGDHVVSPGVIDCHVHVNEPGRTEWEGFATATAAAAAGGVTTIVDMPLNSSPVTTTVAALEQKLNAARQQSWVDVGFYGGLVPGNAGHVGPMIQAGVLGIKAFLCDSGLDEFRKVAESDLVAAMPEIAARGVPLLVHCELARAAAPLAQSPTSYAQFCASRPDAWETDAVALMIDLCRRYECRVHIVHLSSARALGLIAAAKRDGLPLTVETCPHYLYFASERIPDGDTRFKCAPPIRAAENRGTLWNALLDNLIDTIGSDHSPCPPQMKCLASGDFTQAWGGIASLQLTLSVVWTAGRQHGVTFRQLATWLSHNPAALVGVDQRKGRIQPGYDADLVVWDPDATFTVGPDMLRHRHRLTPYEGETLSGLVSHTYLRGRLVYADGLLGGQPSGLCVRLESRR